MDIGYRSDSRGAAELVAHLGQALEVTVESSPEFCFFVVT